MAILYTSGTTGAPKGCVLSHGNGTTANILAGSTQILMEVFEPEEAMRLIQQERATIFSGVPTMFITVLGHPIQGLRSALATHGHHRSRPVPVEMMRRILDREHGLGMDATVVYGLTEATGGTHFTRLGDPLDKRVSTVGALYLRARGPDRRSRHRA